MIKVVPKRNEKIQVTLRRLRKLCEREGITKDLRKKMFYEKPSEKRRRAIKRQQKEQEEAKKKL